MSSVEYILETERIALRKFTLCDIAFIRKLLNSPGWLTFIGDKNVKTDEQARTYLETGPWASYRENGYGLYLVEKKEDRTPIGTCGVLNRLTLENPDLGFAFLPEYERLGFATESARAVLTHCRGKLAISDVDAITRADNVRSVKLLEKIGFTYCGRITLPNTDDELCLYRCRKNRVE